MAIKPGRQLTFTIALRSGTSPLSIPASATVNAQIYALDGFTPVSSLVPVLPSEIGSVWSDGLVVATFSAEDTALISAPQCSIVVTVTDGASTRNWSTDVEVDAADQDSTALFQRAIAVKRFRVERLAGIQKYLDAEVTDDYIWDKLRAAEADAGHTLRVLLAPTTVFAGDPTQAEIMALGSAPYIIEPGYDFDPSMWQGDRWGFVATRQKPIIAVSNVEFSWLGTGSVFAMPANWIRCDRKYGHIQFVPSGAAQNMPLSMYMMQAMGGGRTMPQMIRMRYTAGLENAARDYPDLIDLVQRMAAMRMMQDAMLAASGSISADGLSQSTSAPDLDKMGAALDLALWRIRDRIHGIRVAFA